jgi:hypothetical protein
MFYGMTSRGQLTGANDVSSLHGGYTAYYDVSVRLYFY